ncbi:hypothetical protein Pam3_67 [Pseudanabaena phage Pam3]|nr:hypothetical protein Pam3_67 [Pseudanabaena phage Pam3]
MILAYIRVANLYSKLEKKGGEYVRTTQHGPGSRRIVSTVSELKAAEICSFSDWTVCDALKEAKASQFPFQAVLAELMDM